MSALPSRHYESETALKIRLALAKRKISKYESEITRLMDLNRDAGRELARFLEEGITPIQLPHVTKRKIQDLGNRLRRSRRRLSFLLCNLGGSWSGISILRLRNIPLRSCLCMKCLGGLANAFSLLGRSARSSHF